MTKKLNLYTLSGAGGFYLLPAEIQQYITSLFITLIKPELKYIRFQNRLSDTPVFVSNYCQKLDSPENKIAYDEDCADDRYVQSIFVAEKTPHYYLHLKRSRIGILKMLDCKQKELSLVTFKNNSTKVRPIIKEMIKDTIFRYGIYQCSLYSINLIVLRLP